jgi:hypothetical protein
MVAMRFSRPTAENDQEAEASTERPLHVADVHGVFDERAEFGDL